MQRLAAVLLLLMLIGSCKKETVTPPVRNLSDAGYVNEIDSYKEGSYWIYTWVENDWGGNKIKSGFDTISVTANIPCNNCRELTGTVFGKPYTGVYTITNDTISYFNTGESLYNMHWKTLIFIDSSQLRLDYPISSEGRGCTISLVYTQVPNIQFHCRAGEFLTLESKQMTAIGNNNGGCDGGYEITRYAPGIGEVYRETSRPYSYTWDATIRYTRELFAYNIAH